MVFRILIPVTLFLVLASPAWAQQKQLVDRVVAVVNDEAITQSEVDLYLRPLYEELRQQYQGEELMHQLNEIRLKLLSQIIEDRLVFQEAKTRGVIVEENEIDEMLKETQSRFANEDEFEKMLSDNGYSLNDLRENYRRQISIRKLHDTEIRSRVVVSPEEVENYYQTHHSEFAEEESLKLHSITLRKNEEAVKKGILDEAAKEKAKSIRDRILKGENFEKLAHEFSEDANAPQGGDVGWVKRGIMIPSIDEVLFELQPGGISPILETALGYHIFKVEEKKTGRVPSLEEVREKIRRILFQEKAKQRFKEWMEELKSRAYISVR